MAPEAIASAVASALGIVAALIPGFLAAFSGSDSDEHAIERARLAVASVRRNPAQAGIDRWRRAFAAQKK